MGLLRPRVFRPFPAREIVEYLQNLRAVAVMDRTLSPGAPAGPMFADVRAALYEHETRPRVLGRAYGLGGRAITEREIRALYDELDDEAAPTFQVVGVRE